MDRKSLTTDLSLSIIGGVDGTDSDLNTSNGRSIFLYKDGDLIIGRAEVSVGSGAPGANAGTVAFALTIADDGMLKTAQYLALYHGNAADPDESATPLTLAGKITINGSSTLTDGDDDFATGTNSLDIGSLVKFEDDGPTAFTPDDASLTNEAGAWVTENLDIDGNIDDNVGADQPGTIAFTNITDGDQAVGVIDDITVDLSSGGQNILLYLVDDDDDSATPDRLEGWTGGYETGTQIFTVTLNPDGDPALSTDTYTVNVLAPIGATTSQSVTDFSSLGQNTQDFKRLDVTDTTADLLFSGSTRASDGTIAFGDVSASTVGVGVDNNQMDDGNILRIDFVNSAVVTTGNNNTYDYTDHYNINDFAFTIVKESGSPPANSIETWVRIYNANNDDPDTTSNSDHLNALVNDPQLATITEITVFKYDSAIIPNLTSTVIYDLVTNPNSLVSDENGGYLVPGLDLNDKVLVTALGGYNRIEVENAISPTDPLTPSLNGEAFDLGGLAYVTTTTNIPAVDLNYDVRLTDADGDSINSSLNITLTAPAVPPVVLDLNGDGLHFLAHDDPSNHARFDFNGDGSADLSAWIVQDDGFLAYDANGSNSVDNSAEIVFTQGHPEVQSDLEALRMFFDSNDDGILDSGDVDFSNFGVWQDANSNGISEAGEYSTLAEMGIASIGLIGGGQGYTAANGEVVVTGSTSFTHVDGSDGLAADATFWIAGVPPETFF